MTAEHNKEHFYSSYKLGSWNPGDSQHLLSEAEDLQLHKLNLSPLTPEKMQL